MKYALAKSKPFSWRRRFPALSLGSSGGVSTPPEPSQCHSMRSSKIGQDHIRTAAASLLGLAEQIVQKEPASSTSQLTILITGDHTTAMSLYGWRNTPFPGLGRPLKDGKQSGVGNRIYWLTFCTDVRASAAPSSLRFSSA